MLIHNRYKYQGGEDAVFEAESDLLSTHGNQVEELIFDNREIVGGFTKVLYGLKGVYNYESASRTREAIRRFKPDIVHVHNFFPIASPAIFYEIKKCNIPIVVTLHNFRLICPSGSLYYNGEIYESNIHSLIPWDGIRKGVYRNSRLETLGLASTTVIHNIIGTWKNKIDKFIVLSEFARKKFSESVLRAPTERFVVKPNFVHDFGLGQTKREDFFLIAGRLSSEKGIDTVLKAFALNEFRLVIIGDGPLKDQVKAAVKTNPNIEYVGFQRRDVLINYIKRCKALLVPSVCYEGLPVTILESFATGTPVIVSRLGSLAEIVMDKNNGLHFEAGNAEDLNEKISMLSKDGTLAQTLGTNARAAYLHKYTPEKNYKKILRIYNELNAVRQQ
jgi:glycosyltransferase involved in cell wall biosynthesis